FPGAEYPATWYHSALADKLAGEDLLPAFFDIRARFSSQFAFYLGFDNNEPPGLVDLLPVVLHEMGHGLGFANFTDETSGTQAFVFVDTFPPYPPAVPTGNRWTHITNPGRQAPAINVRHVSWDGLPATAAVPSVLSPGEPNLAIASPAGLGPFAVGAASF